MSVVPDTSVWIDHLRSPLAAMDALIAARDVVMHPAVIGELAVGNLPDRAAFLASLALMPGTGEPLAADVLAFIERHRLFGRGLSWVDAQLLTSSEATGHRLWTLDKRLEEAARSLGFAWTP